MSAPLTWHGVSLQVAQMQNTSVPLFESGMTEMPGTGSMIVQDMLDGTYSWTLDTDGEVQRYS